MGFSSGVDEPQIEIGATVLCDIGEFKIILRKLGFNLAVVVFKV